jgi:hypothetical protein
MDNLLLVKQSSGKFGKVATVILLSPVHQGRVKLSSLPWNQCPVWRAMGVQFGPENAVNLNRL